MATPKNLITFREVVLQSFSRSTKGGVASFRSQLTDHVKSAMNWSDLPETYTGGSPEGEISARTLALAPAEKALSMHRIDLSVSLLHKFTVVRRELEDKRGKGHRFELHFNVKFDDQRGCKKLEQYIQTIGEGKSLLTVSYEKQAELEDASDKQRTLTEEE